jgi:hypothetical protein
VIESRSPHLGRDLIVRLPQAPEPAFFDQIFRLDHAAWRAAIVEVCAAHRIECDTVSTFADGSNLVADVDNRWIVKIFPTSVTPTSTYRFVFPVGASARPPSRHWPS